MVLNGRYSIHSAMAIHSCHVQVSCVPRRRSSQHSVSVGYTARRAPNCTACMKSFPLQVTNTYLFLWGPRAENALLPQPSPQILAPQLGLDEAVMLGNVQSGLPHMRVRWILHPVQPPVYSFSIA